jgi:pimeloyl-ACP methyl ester carboxylesterase
MATFVLVHGAFHGAWCWYKVVARLEAKGHTVVAPDLPGHGRNRIPGPPVSLEIYVDFLADLLRAQPEPVILVGHSMGGAVITGAGEAVPEKLSKAVYLAAVMPRSGDSMVAGAPARPEGRLPIFVRVDEAHTRIEDAAVGPLFYHDCSAEDVALARLCLTPQSMQPMISPIVWTPERLGAVRKLYIGCLQDRVVGDIDHQRKLAQNMPGTDFVTLDASHSPFFSMPDQLVDVLEAAIA